MFVKQKLFLDVKAEKDLQCNVKTLECAQSAILTPAPKESAVRKTGFGQESPCLNNDRVQENGSGDSGERINSKNGSKSDLTQETYSDIK